MTDARYCIRAGLQWVAGIRYRIDGETELRLGDTPMIWWSKERAEQLSALLPGGVVETDQETSDPHHMPSQQINKPE